MLNVEAPFKGFLILKFCFLFSPISHVRFFVGTFQTVFPRLQQVRSDFRRRLEQPEVFVVAQKIVSLAENQRRPVEIVFYSGEQL
jgi:hypothetical protein